MNHGGDSLRPDHARTHSRDFPGYWLSPGGARYELTPDEHHRDFFLQHGELFSGRPNECVTLAEAYERGWISIRRWENGPWAIVCASFENSRNLLRQWAQHVLAHWPHEAKTQLLIRTFEDQPLPETIFLDHLLR